MALSAPRGLSENEVGPAIALINQVFRGDADQGPTMAQEFPALLCNANRENMRAIFDEQVPISVVSFYTAQLLLYGCRLNGAFVGAVTTHPGYRHRGLASMLLRDGEAKMRSEGADIGFISGTSLVYQRQGYRPILKYNHFIMHQLSEQGPEITTRKAVKEDFAGIRRLYREDTCRFIRSSKEFEKLYAGTMVKTSRRKSDCMVAECGGNLVAYAILAHNSDDEVVLTECAGNRCMVFWMLQKFMHCHNVQHIQGYLALNDPLSGVLKVHFQLCEPQLIDHTVRILNFPSLMEKLRPLFEEIVSEKNEIPAFSAQFGKCLLQLGEETLEISEEEATDMVFGQGYNAVKQLKKLPALSGFVKAVFPVALPWIGGLNYI